MTVSSESCESLMSCERFSSPGSSHLFNAETERNRRLCKRFRSTKGASKARRDQINEEIRNMRALLPIIQDDQERMSYLHSMAVITAYIRTNLLFQGLSTYQSHLASSFPCSAVCPPYDSFLPALQGFIVVLSSQGRLVYVSENVSDYLGLSMVDVLQGDTFYDMVETQDIETVRSHLDVDSITSTERSFVCRMHTSKAFRLLHGHCSILVQGRYQEVLRPPSMSSPGQSPPLETVFVGLCTPTVNRLHSSTSSSRSSFDSLHKPDMSFTGVDDSVIFHLGYSSEELIGRSWYSLLHPEDLHLTACSHKSLMQADEGCHTELVFRLQHSDLTWPWIYTRAAKHSANQEVSCTNYIISETEAMFLRQIHSNTIIPSPPQIHCPSPSPQLAQAVALKRPNASSQSSSVPGREKPMAETTRTCSLDVMSDSPASFSTPPYSPASYSPSNSSCYSPIRLEGSVFLLGHTEIPHGPVTSSPDQDIFNLTNTFSPQSCPPSPHWDFPAFSADARLVPECLPVSDMLESSADCSITIHTEDLPAYLSAQPPEGATSPYHMHHRVPQGLLTPNPSPTADLSFHYSTREQAEISILAQQISSLASSFDMGPVQTTSQAVPMLEPVPWALQQAQSPVLDEGVFHSLLKDLGMVQGPGCLSPCYLSQDPCSTTALSSQGDPLPMEPSPLSLPLPLEYSPLCLSLPIEGSHTAHSSVDLCTMRTGCHDDISELHQLNHYLQHSLQQDGLVEESMY
ncbi:neuronal PAS domain-containing protein 4-like [Esox lucius]|uniref:neuronal PAS domain-containing protein 4-like n=1 Tax=Esox lucius TaxID=8010 RepID=UPI001476B705|nr:neuronal PAS domain-containing protein 4-like [Esox lucius]XP_034147950.1 neuronal PAS domain-containing protein 4-like [Esox lucius]